jgi:ABC-type glycerol-3-phosphate transport system permease component
MMMNYEKKNTMRSKKKNFIDHLADWINWRRFIFAAAMIFFLVSILFPFYWMISSSFKSFAEIGGREPVIYTGAIAYGGL